MRLMTRAANRGFVTAMVGLAQLHERGQIDGRRDLVLAHQWHLKNAYIPLDIVRAIETAVTASNDAVTFKTYAGADHAFDNPSPMFHHAEASAAAWSTTVAWLGEHLPVGASAS